MASTAGSSDLVRAYLREIGRVNLLSQEEELLLARQVQRREALLRSSKTNTTKAEAIDPAVRRQLLHQGKRAKERMVAANLRLVVAVAKKYQQRGLELLDLVQEGSLGLDRAVERFDPTRGFRFSTYAYWWIRQSITRALASQGRTIRLPAHVSEKLARLRKAQRALTAELGREASMDELAEATLMSPDEVRTTLQRQAQPVSLETPVGANGETLLGELLEDPHPTPEQDLALKQLHEAIETALLQLDGREQRIIRERFGLGETAPSNLSEIGERLQLSRERVRQIETRALHKLRQPQNRCRLGDYLSNLER